MNKIIIREKITVEEMERAIKEMESEGYVNVKVTHCHYWQGEKL